MRKIKILNAAIILALFIGIFYSWPIKTIKTAETLSSVWSKTTEQTVTEPLSKTQYSTQTKTQNGDSAKTSPSNSDPETTQTKSAIEENSTTKSTDTSSNNDDKKTITEIVTTDKTAETTNEKTSIETADKVQEILEEATNSSINKIEEILKNNEKTTDEIQKIPEKNNDAENTTENTENTKNTTDTDTIDANINTTANKYYKPSSPTKKEDDDTSFDPLGASENLGEKYDLINVENKEAETIATVAISNDSNVTDTDKDIAANTIKEGIEESIDRAITDTGKAIETYINLGKGKRSKIKIENKDEVAIIFGIRKNEEDIKKEKESVEKEKKTVLIIDENTNLDNDGISDIYQIQHDIPLFNTDPDKDGIKTVDEIYLGLNPVAPDTISETPRITNIGGMKTGPRPSIRLSGRPNDIANVYLIAKKDPNRSKKHIGRTLIDETRKGEITVGFDLADGEYYAVPETKDSAGEAVEFIVDSEIDLNTPKIEQKEQREIGPSVKNVIIIVSKIVPYLHLERFLIQWEEEIKERKRIFIGYTDPGKVVYVTWKSILLSSVVISDASQGKFEIAVPDNLSKGNHEVISYAMDEKKKIISSIYRLIFKK